MDTLVESSKAAAARRTSIDESAGSKTTAVRDEKGKQKELASSEIVMKNGKEDDQVHSEAESLYDVDDDESLHCAICLSVIDDRTVIQPCCHDAYCFACILAWSEQSRRCPLCMANVDLLIHNIRSEKDYSKYYLPPLLKSDSPPPERSFRELQEGARRQLFNRPTHPRFKYADWRARNKPVVMPEVDAEDLALEKRKYIYKHGLYVKHVASNRYTRFRDHTVQQFSNSPELKQRMTKWLRRELRVFDGVDLEFLVGYALNIASQLELRSDSATRLLAEFIGDEQAEHFWHETYSFLRSPYKDIRHYDKAIQYDRPPCKMDNDITGRSKSSRRNSISHRRSLSPPESDYEDRFDSRKDHRDTAEARRRSSLTKGDLKRGEARRTEGDTYIPSYSKLNRARRRARSRSMEARPIDNFERNVRRAMPKDIEERSQARDDPVAPKYDSDMDDIVSLGDAEVYVGPLVKSRDAPPAQGAHNASRDPRQNALHIRGIASVRSTAGQSNIDVIQELGPDLLSRLSNGHELEATGNQKAPIEDLSNQTAGAIIQKGRGFRRGQLTEAMQADLMAKVQKEQKANSRQSNGADAGKSPVVSEETEASLREHVLAVLKQRRQEKMQKDLSDVKVDEPAHFSSGTDTPEVSLTDMSQPKDANSADAEAARAKLRERLARGRAALSPTGDSSQSRAPAGLNNGSMTPPTVESKEQELKRRLAARRASAKT